MNEDALRDKQTQYVSYGEGEPVIFIHGVGLDHTMWQYQLDYFPSFFRVYAYDMVGHGASKMPSKDFYELKDFVIQLKNFMEVTHIEKAHIVGFSMGGMVAQAFSITYPEKVQTLTISNAVAMRNEEERKHVLNRVELVEKDGKNSTIGAAIERWFSQDFMKKNPDIIMKIRKRLEENNERAYLNAYRVFATADKELWDKLNQIQVPVFIITGELDRGSNPRMAEQMERKIPSAELFIAPGIRHMLPVEGARIFNEYVSEFLSQHKEVKDNECR